MSGDDDDDDDDAGEVGWRAMSLVKSVWGRGSWGELEQLELLVLESSEENFMLNLEAEGELKDGEQLPNSVFFDRVGVETVRRNIFGFYWLLATVLLQNLGPPKNYKKSIANPHHLYIPHIPPHTSSIHACSASESTYYPNFELS